MKFNTLNNQFFNEHDDHRCRGLTTAIALQAISSAINNPNQKVEFVDHYGTRLANHNLRSQIIQIIVTLDLKNITVSTNPNNMDAVTLYFELWKEVPELFIDSNAINSSTYVQINGGLYRKVPMSNGK